MGKASSGIIYEAMLRLKPSRPDESMFKLAAIGFQEPSLQQRGAGVGFGTEWNTMAAPMQGPHEPVLSIVVGSAESS